MIILQDPVFWQSFFAFLGSVVGAFSLLFRLWFHYKDKAALKKSKLDASVERMKADNAIKLISFLKETVEKMEPLVKNHEEVVNLLHQSIRGVDQTEKEMTKMMLELKLQYGNFESRMNQVQSGGYSLMSRLNNIETEIVTLKSGNIFVKTKK